MTVLPDGVEALIPAYLGLQRWYAGADAPDPASVSVEWARELWAAEDDGVRLWQAVVAIDQGTDPARYQLLIGERSIGDRADFLHGREEAVLGPLDGSTFYDAALDSELARVVLEVASGGQETAQLARPMGAEQSNTSLVFDDRLILKVFRRLHPGHNPDVEVTSALAAAGFEHVAAPFVTWREEPYDLAFGQQFLAGGSEGWALALTSLRDLYNSGAAHPAEAGGDFAAEARRLGRITAEMHLALRAALPGPASAASTTRSWALLVDGIETRLLSALEAAAESPDCADSDTACARGLIARLRTVTDPGPFGRVHGDYHLGQVMQTDTGWYVLDFEGEPSKPLDARKAPTSPLKDVSSMLRSFDYAARHVLTERASTELDQLESMAEAWEAHNRQAFLEGYRDVPDIVALLPEPSLTPVVLAAYEVDKALYELDYERAHRPDWVSIPMAALRRMVCGDTGADSAKT